MMNKQTEHQEAKNQNIPTPYALESERAGVSHDLLKNRCLEMLGTSGGDFDTQPLKRKIIEDAWIAINTETVSPAWNSIRRAQKEWSDVKKGIYNFMESGPQRHGMKGTALFNEVATKCLDPNTGWLRIMADFIENIEIHAALDSTKQELLLRTFWEAADELSRAFTSMRPRTTGEGPRFGDYFQR